MTGIGGSRNFGLHDYAASGPSVDARAMMVTVQALGASSSGCEGFAKRHPGI
jgi:hypothetical protein